MDGLILFFGRLLEYAGGQGGGERQTQTGWAFFFLLYFLGVQLANLGKNTEGGRGEVTRYFLSCGFAYADVDVDADVIARFCFGGLICMCSIKSERENYVILGTFFESVCCCCFLVIDEMRHAG